MSKRSTQALPPLDPLQRYEITEAAEYLRISRSRLYEDINTGRLRTIKDGSRVYVPGSEIVRRSTLGGMPPASGPAASGSDFSA